VTWMEGEGREGVIQQTTCSKSIGSGSEERGSSPRGRSVYSLIGLEPGTRRNLMFKERVCCCFDEKLDDEKWRGWKGIKAEEIKSGCREYWHVKGVPLDVMLRICWEEVR